MAFVSLNILKKHLRVSGTSEDDLIQSYYYPAAVSWVADYTGRDLEQVQRVYTATVGDGVKAVLPAYPVQTVDTVEQSSVGVSFTSEIVAGTGEAIVTPTGHDASEPITITFTVGYADANLPTPMKQALLFLVGHFFHNRSEVDTNKMSDVPEGAKRLCDPFRLRTFAGA
jgi:uncharacterized phiE125 gp8 family phage protein